MSCSIMRGGGGCGERWDWITWDVRKSPNSLPPISNKYNCLLLYECLQHERWPSSHNLEASDANRLSVLGYVSLEYAVCVYLWVKCSGYDNEIRNSWVSDRSITGLMEMWVWQGWDTAHFTSLSNCICHQCNQLYSFFWGGKEG